MIDSLISGMPFSDTSVLLPDDGRSLHSAKRNGTVSGVPLPQCKKHKKSHKWSKKARSRDTVKSKCKLKKGLRNKPEAPFNSTQFIMQEHDNFNDSDLSTLLPRRQRDSSISMDSEDPGEEGYGSPEEFITQQFWYAYEEYHAERLDAMSKGQLVQEYFILEEKLNNLERELKAAREQDRRKIREPSPIDDEDEEDIPPGEIRVDAETAAKIEVFRSEIEKLEVENSRLREENSTLRRKSCRRCRALANISSDAVSRSQSNSDSSSSSDSSSDSSDSDSDSDTRNLFSKQGNLCGDQNDSKGTMSPRTSARLSQRSTTVDFISDSGIASSSSGDDLKVNRRGNKKLKSEDKKYSSSEEGKLQSEVNEVKKVFELNPVEFVEAI